MKDSGGMHVHFVGIAGIGMSGIAHVLAELGYEVSGSDLRETHLTKKLEQKGIRFYLGHAPANIAGADIVVVSSAIPGENPEVTQAKAENIPVLQRAEMLAYLMRDRFGIAVAGTHGKTTTTSMVAAIMESAGLDPTVVVGGELHGLGHNAKLGKSRYIVAEADESDASFLKLSPKVAVVTNVDADVNPRAGPFAVLEFDFDKTMRRIQEVFLEFLQRIPEDGYAVMCWDCPVLREMKHLLGCKVLTYGLHQPADLMAANLEFQDSTSRFDAMFQGKALGIVSLKVPGEHNVLNALGALGAVLQLGVSFEAARNALAQFEGVKRRFEVLGEVGRILVVDDYAHNPTKIKATLAAAKRGWKRRTVTVFQPHRYTRSKFLRKEFAHAFQDADLLLVTQIYAAGEEPIPGISGESLAQDIQRSYPEKPVYFAQTEQAAVQKLLEVVRPGDIVITMGAGDIYRVGYRLLENLKLNCRNAS